MNKLKSCWLAKEVKGGWKLTLEIGQYTFKPKPNKIYKTTKSVQSFAEAFDIKKSAIVFIHLKNTKFPEQKCKKCGTTWIAKEKLPCPECK